MSKRKHKQKKKVLFFILLLIVGIICYFNKDFYIFVKDNVIEPFTKEIDKQSKKVSSKKSEVQEMSQSILGLDVYFIDVGQADAILIRNGEHNVLIDAGNNADGKLLVDYFKSLNITSFDYVFATHPHEDHIGGMDEVIDNFKIKNFYMTNESTTTRTYLNVLDALERKGMTFKIPKVNQNIKVGDSSFKVLYVGDNNEDINESSLIIKLTYKDNIFLFNGDSSSNIEDMLSEDLVKCDVLKLAHHGSSSSSSTKFLNMASPKFAVISVGKNNDYGHPHSETLKRLKKINAKIYRTDYLGTIIFHSDGSNITVSNISTNTNGVEE